MLFQDVWILTILPVLIVVAIVFRRRDLTGGVQFSSGEFFPAHKPSWRIIICENLWFLRMCAAALFIVALARPQVPLDMSQVHTEGIDIILSVDTSGSMKAEDFTLKGKRANRLAVVKDVVEDFISGREHDRIGLVAFAARAYTVCPLTLDYGWVLENLERFEIGMIEDGTAIGAGLATALNRIKNTEAKAKVVIILTDGRHNAGKISPQTAADAAQALDIKVYTIGAGTRGRAPYPVQDFFGNTVYQPVDIEIDEKTLKMIADKTGGKYFRATDTESLKEIYKEIDRLERTDIEEYGYMEYKELFPYCVMVGLVLIILEIVLGNTVARKLP